MNIQVHEPIYSWTKFQRVPHKPNFPELLKKGGEWQKLHVHTYIENINYIWQNINSDSASERFILG